MKQDKESKVLKELKKWLKRLNMGAITQHEKDRDNEDYYLAIISKKAITFSEETLDKITELENAKTNSKK